jgi:cytochrome c oxidase cbb3-type subunit 3
MSDRDKKTGHIYDGIEELDHPAPNWFMLLFYVTIVFGLGYSVYYLLGDGPTLTQEYERSRDAEEYARYQSASSTGAPRALTESELATLAKDAGQRSRGQVSFQAKCASCHGSVGQGGIGPNLTDPYWLHGGRLTEVAATITQGVADKGMPPWGPVLPPAEVNALVAYIHGLAGTHPAGAKAPQGTLFRE